MKIKSDMWPVTSDKKNRPACGVQPCHSSLVTRHSQHGIALVITLILLSVTLFMALAFLAVSRRERGSVLTETDTVTARLAADSGLANAEAQILATVLQTTNPYNFGLLVSTNYINANGYNTSFLPSVANPLNVSYVYPNGNPLTPDDFKQNVANLWYLPRAPVFVYDRTSGSNDFRFYLDLNRNGQYDPNGLVPVIGQLGGFLHPNGTEDNNNVNVVTNFQLGDPEWIGVLERPDAPHGPNNKFLSRYAFIALPAGNTLDLNAIHNEALHDNASALVNPPATGDTFLRNQGVGSWEINLAAFLADLNTNEWNNISSPYNYARWFNNQNTGVAFDDARALLAYRYSNNYNTLRTFTSLFPNHTLLGGAVDMFPFGPLMTTTGVPFYNYGLNNAWSGADNTNHYFTLSSDLFDPNKTEINIGASLGFIDRLQFASTNVNHSTYDRYTFYRLLSQLGTDSAPEADKINVNYVNVDNQGNIIANKETNAIAWEPAQFFTNAADRMLRAYTTQWFQTGPSNYLATYYNIHTNYFYDFAGNIVANDPNGYGLTNLPVFGITNTIPAFGVGNIPVWVNNQFVYGPAVQRVLQLVANIHDATTNNTVALNENFPSVFRPFFDVENGSIGRNVFIAGYSEVTDVNPATLGQVSNPTVQPLGLPENLNNLAVNLPASPNVHNLVNIYGVPWVIGAKKGFPNFNEISMNNVVTVTRKLQVRREYLTPKSPIVATNAAYIFSISNSVGIEFWNSYTNAYTNPFQVVVIDNVSMNLTNDRGYSVQQYQSLSPLNNNTTYTFWPGSTWINGGGLSPSAASPFIVPVNTSIPFITNEVVQWSGNYGFGNTLWQIGQTELTLPHIGLLTTNRLQAYILSTDKNGFHRIVDYVHLNGPDSQRDLTAEIQTTMKQASYDNMWDTNMTSSGRRGPVPWGIMSQMGVSQQLIPQGNNNWGSGNDLNRAITAVDAFAFFMGGTPPMPVPAGFEAVYNSYLTNYTMQVPYTPTVVASYYSSWQANDPLVHSFPGDLIFTDLTGPPRTGTNVVFSSLVVNSTAATSTATNGLPNIGALNQRYQPWGRAYSYSGANNNPYDATLKDPLVGRSDDWAFPTNKLPSVGWLGRIHRGTPWQTVYLKATNILGLVNGSNTWVYWTGNNNVFDATNAAPVQDRLLFDVFTTALNDNASRGQLPINVAASDTGNPAAGLAAWSAVFSGVAVPTNLLGGYTIINPVGVDMTTNSPLYAIVANINSIRKAYTNNASQGGAFKHVGDILSVATLSQGSPFLAGMNITNNIPDALMEWLPQQTMSLLRVGNQPRFVIYSYGQTLAPAANGIVNSGNQAGMITNYQVTAETVTRAVVRVEGAPTNTHTVVESYNILPPD